ncbi:hypothetical protein [Xanthocytophaga flava]|uniref:hypothetical protein n=1 Tax=Xanthocytophaga flava TaxID=3048013 RepID=UPI0028D8A6CF|nr:hypothetical protein [Xanthocytophaga flavus]MDJ1466940.1 hypothetical protein [Xanthocytophaga flavus]
MKFTEVPITYFNGTTDVSIPIYTFQSGDIKIPITLAYHTSGIKVTEEASWTGLGWNLQVSGAIVQSIMGVPDSSQTMMDPVNPNFPPFINTDTIAHHVINNGTCFKNENGVFVDRRGDLTSTGGDCTIPHDSRDLKSVEFDLFSYNFLGHSGKFIIPGRAYTNQPLTPLDQNNIQFSRYNTYGFMARTPDGFTYIFNDIAMTSTLAFPGRSGVDNQTDSYTYYLSKIISPTGKIVEFKYRKVLSRIAPTGSHTFRSSRLGIVTPYPRWKYTEDPGIYVSLYMTTIETLYLEEIQADNGSVKFISSSRLDIENGLKLDAVEIYQKGNTIPLEKVLFNYDYFMSGDTGSSIIPSGSVHPDYPSEYMGKRLKLLSVKTNDLPPYVFTYDSTPLPSKISSSQDIWGYYNGKYNVSLIPSYELVQYFQSGLYPSFFEDNEIGFNEQLGDRWADPVYMQACILKKITYPLGGYTSIAYEPNTFIPPIREIVVTQDVSKGAADIGVGVKSTDIELVSIGKDASGNEILNPVKLEITLLCCGDQANCGMCSSYCNPYTDDVRYKGRSIYCLLEKYDPATDKWILSDDNIFDRNHPAYSTQISCQYTVNKSLSPGKYRITANYPDDFVPGSPGNKMATITMKYKIPDPTKRRSIGGGLRVKNIINYTEDNKVANARYMSYSEGTLMTLPIFFLEPSFRPNTSFPFDELPCVYNPVLICGACIQGIIVPFDYFSKSIYSNPVSPHSYSAQGGLVGYSQVTIEYDENKKKGKTVYSYNLTQDSYDRSIRIAGIPSVHSLKNGSISEIIDFKYENETYTPVKKISNDYRIDGSKLYWLFRTDYFYSYAACATGENPSLIDLVTRQEVYDPRRVYTYFYPLQSGHLNLIKKTEIVYDTDKEIRVLSQYRYNKNHQTIEEKAYSSNNLPLSKIYSYPSDYKVANGILKEMQDRNLIIYPVETLTKVNNKVTQGIYNEYYLHDNIISLGQVHALETNVPIDNFVESKENNSKSDLYVPKLLSQYNKYGNLISQAKTDDIPIVYLWGYNSSNLIAEIKNATFSDVLSALKLDQLTLNQYASEQTPSEKYTQKVNDLRQNLPTALITTYSYLPLVGMKTMTGPDGKTLTYEYDSLQRLHLLKDHKGNIIKQYRYHYQGQAPLD